MFRFLVPCCTIVFFPFLRVFLFWNCHLIEKREKKHDNNNNDFKWFHLLLLLFILFLLERHNFQHHQPLINNILPMVCVSVYSQSDDFIHFLMFSLSLSLCHHFVWCNAPAWLNVVCIVAVTEILIFWFRLLKMGTDTDAYRHVWVYTVCELWRYTGWKSDTKRTHAHTYNRYNISMYINGMLLAQLLVRSPINSSSFVPQR